MAKRKSFLFLSTNPGFATNLLWLDMNYHQNCYFHVETYQSGVSLFCGVGEI